MKSHTLTVRPICPHCFQQDDQTFLDIQGEDAIEGPCSHCGKEYRCTATALVLYTTEKMEEPND